MNPALPPVALRRTATISSYRPAPHRKAFIATGMTLVERRERPAR
jgi:hypothetical protein